MAARICSGDAGVGPRSCASAGDDDRNDEQTADRERRRRASAYRFRFFFRQRLALAVDLERQLQVAALIARERHRVVAGVARRAVRRALRFTDDSRPPRLR